MKRLFFVLDNSSAFLFPESTNIEDGNLVVALEQDFLDAISKSLSCPRQLSMFLIPWIGTSAILLFLSRYAHKQRCDDYKE